VPRERRPVPQLPDDEPLPPQPCQEAGVQDRGLDPLDEAVRLHDLAVSRRAEGKLREAVPLCRQALTLVERAIGLHHPDVANILNSLAGLYADLSDYAEAEQLSQRSVALMEAVTRSREVEVLRVQLLGTLAGISRAQRRYAEAEPLYRRALALVETVLGPEDLEVATCLNNRAVLHKCTGRFAAAQCLYRRALAIAQQALGRNHPDVAVIYHNLGGLEHARGRYARGEPYARRAVAIREQALGPEHPDVAALAAILDGQDQYDEAQALYRRALTIFERVYSPNGSVIQVMLWPQNPGIVGENHQPTPGRPAGSYGHERCVSSVWIPAVQEKRSCSQWQTEPLMQGLRPTICCAC